MPIKVSPSPQQIAKDLKRKQTQYRKGLKVFMFRALTLLEVEIKINIRKNFTVRTGTLLNSVQKEIVETRDSIVGTVGPENVPYAAIHEFGGKITPVKSRFLAIPLPSNRRPDGLARISTQEARNRGSFIAKGVIFLKEGSAITPIFALKKSVNIPARPYIAPAMEAREDDIADRFGLFLNQVIVDG